MDSSNNWHGINFIISLVAIIIIIIVLFVIFDHRRDVEQFALGWRLANGTTTGTTDTFITNTNTMYIGQSSQDVTLTLRSGDDFIGGVIGFKNNTTNTNILLTPESNVIIADNQVLVIAPGAFSEWILTNNGYLRLDNQFALQSLTPVPLQQPIINLNPSSAVSTVQNPLKNVVST